MTEVEVLEADLAVLAHDLERTRAELDCAFERIARLENSQQIFEVQHPDRIRLARLERAFKVLAENPGSPHYAAKAALEIVEG